MVKRYPEMPRKRASPQAKSGNIFGQADRSAENVAGRLHARLHQRSADTGDAVRATGGYAARQRRPDPNQMDLILARDGGGE
jgi:hypothetical protein